MATLLTIFEVVDRSHVQSDIRYYCDLFYQGVVLYEHPINTCIQPLFYNRLLLQQFPTLVIILDYKLIRKLHYRDEAMPSESINSFNTMILIIAIYERRNNNLSVIGYKLDRLFCLFFAMSHFYAFFFLKPIQYICKSGYNKWCCYIFLLKVFFSSY